VTKKIEYISYCMSLLNHNEEHTTEMEEKAIAPPAAQEGSRSAKYGNKMPAARGIARMLCPIANTNSI
jgi:hypothetical protein